MKFIHQHDQMDCGPACLAMITDFYSNPYPLAYLRDECFLSKEGVSLKGVSDASKKLGFETLSAKLDLNSLFANQHFPCIIHWNQNHFVVLSKISKNLLNKYTFNIADPGFGILKLSEEEFCKGWIGAEDKGIALFLKPTEAFKRNKAPKPPKKTFRFLLKYLKPYKMELLQLLIGLLCGSALTLVFPFLTQALIDKGIGNQSMRTIYIILFAQIFLFLGNSVIEIIRNWITLFIGARINVTIISDFLAKLMKLPIKFFDTKMMGDFTQRIGDHERIEKFLTSQSLLTLFSLVNISVFLIVLAYYDIKILGAYIILTGLAIVWAIYFLRKRKFLDYQSFQQRAENQDSVYELINGMQEIKLNDFQRYKRRGWENIQVNLFKINQRILKVDQFQETGFEFLNHFKNIFVTFIAANEVIKGNITIGAMLSISYIIGQMNSPIGQLIIFFRSYQDARISLERLGEVHHQEEEDGVKKEMKVEGNETHIFTNLKGLKLSNLNFQYEGPDSPLVLKNINMLIPSGKKTAIVGASGSGKTTLLKLLLKFYEPTNGKICIDGRNLEGFSAESLRRQCGTVMQDGYIFSDSIERNIATSEDTIDKDKLWNALEIANLDKYVQNLPLGVKTKIGASGNGLSGGQKQRILIARAVYKDPNYLFFDEATSALDADNEKEIMEKLNHFLEGKTSVTIAHRLSTVRNADKIIVLKNGEIAEYGDHISLVANQADYYHLVRNQLELGS